MNNTTQNPTASGTPGGLLFVPSRRWIEDLAVGDLAPDHCGSMARVVEITYRGEDTNGRAYVGVYTMLSETSRVSQSYKEDRLDRNVGNSRAFDSAALDAIEKAFLARRGKLTELKERGKKRESDYIMGRDCDEENDEATRAIVRDLTTPK